MTYNYRYISHRITLRGTFTLGSQDEFFRRISLQRKRDIYGGYLLSFHVYAFVEFVINHEIGIH